MMREIQACISQFREKEGVNAILRWYLQEIALAVMSAASGSTRVRLFSKVV
jgi:hypothetical protein